MYSLFVLLLALVGLALALRAFLQWQLTRSAMILFVLLPLAALSVELLISGLAQWLGADRSVSGLLAMPLLVTQITLPLSLFALATLCRRVGFAWAKIDWGHGALCILAVLLLIYRLPAALKTSGAQSVPISAVDWLVFAMYLACGFGLWHRQRWPWLLAGMVPGMLLLLPLPVGGPLAAWLGRLLMLAAMTVTMMHFTRLFPVVRKASPVEPGDGSE
ncbi:MAG: hypothetical protein R3F27_09710 [Gammaproteobacteria bacterium]